MCLHDQISIVSNTRRIICLKIKARTFSAFVFFCPKIGFLSVDNQIMVKYNETILALDLNEILYAESVDKKCFIYTADKIYESFHKLYELEQQLEQYLFVRINKSCVVNLNNISSIKTYIDRRLLITLSNNEQLIVSRQYANGIKTLLGVK